MYIRFVVDHPESGYKKGDIAECFIHQKVIRHWYTVANRSHESPLYRTRHRHDHEFLYIKGTLIDYQGKPFISVHEDQAVIVVAPTCNDSAKHLLRETFDEISCSF